MPHLRLYVPEEWLREEFQAETGFNARRLLDRLVEVVAGLRMENPAIEARRQALQARDPQRAVTDEEARRDDKGNPIGPDLVPMINVSNLKHAIVPLTYAHVAGDASQRFLHATLAAGNDTPGRTAAVRRQAAQRLGDAIDAFVGDVPGLTSVTVHVQDIDRDRGIPQQPSVKRRREAGNHNAVPESVKNSRNRSARCAGAHEIPDSNPGHHRDSCGRRHLLLQPDEQARKPAGPPREFDSLRPAVDAAELADIGRRHNEDAGGVTCATRR